jgi:N-acetylglucosaminyldiphosphoundecaprenol N-acetyl-beta-D-mannosaminyltransferase
MDITSAGPRDQRRFHVLGVPVDACRDVSAAAIGIHADGGGQIVTLNAEMTMAARSNPRLAAVIDGADLVVPDGAGVVWALRLQGVRVRRSPGIELAWDLLRYAEAHRWSVALVGAAPNVMERLKERLMVERPELRLVFSQHGYLAEDAWPGLEAQLTELNPDLVFVALGVPRQELWAQRLKSNQAGVWMGVGGSFDVWAGTKQRAPQWASRLQIEWLYRFLQEPSRWRRYLALPHFVWSVLVNGSQQRPAKQKQAKGRRVE